MSRTLRPLAAVAIGLIGAGCSKRICRERQQRHRQQLRHRE
jgi:hypothetical protein